MRNVPQYKISILRHIFHMPATYHWDSMYILLVDKHYTISLYVINCHHTTCCFMKLSILRVTHICTYVRYRHTCVYVLSVRIIRVVEYIDFISYEYCMLVVFPAWLDTWFMLWNLLVIIFIHILRTSRFNLDPSIQLWRTLINGFIFTSMFVIKHFSTLSRFCSKETDHTWTYIVHSACARLIYDGK